jgi:peptidoglycan/xylan/chitin deacetylase (PgdA/CDA1 family)
LAAAALAIVALGSGGSGAGPGSSPARAGHLTATSRSGARRPAREGRSHRTRPSSQGGAPTTSGGAAGRGGAPVPILMYHVINAPPAGAPFPGLYVTPAEFSEQMLALKQAGWHAVTLDQASAYWRRGASLGRGKPVVLSFDNGYHSQYSNALPVLRRLGWVGVENLQLSGLPPSQGGLSTQEVRGLVAAGWELDTQGFNHADLITLDASALHYEVAVAREVIRRRYGVPVNWFCYPSGHYDARVIAAVKAAGYAGSTTVVAGWAHPGEDPYRMHRLRVLGGTSAPELLSLLAGVRGDQPAPASYDGT